MIGDYGKLEREHVSVKYRKRFCFSTIRYREITKNILDIRENKKYIHMKDTEISL